MITGKASLKSKSDLHLARKIWHALGILLMAGIYNYFGREISWYILVAGTLAALFIDFIRLQNPSINLVVQKVFGPVMRDHEKRRYSGLSYLFVGTLILISVFDRHIVNLTLLFLALGDPVASFIGIKYGQDKIVGSKTLQGSIGAFITCALIATIYYYFNNIMIERLVIVSLVSGFIGAAAELIPIGKLDDNFTFPVLASSMLWVLFQLYGGFAL